MVAALDGDVKPGDRSGSVKVAIVYERLAGFDIVALNNRASLSVH